MNKKTVAKAALITAILLLPVITLAAAPAAQTYSAPDQPTPQSLTLENLISKVMDWVWKVFITLAVILMLYAGVTFLLAQGDPAKVATARNFALWGVVGFVVAILAFSLPYIAKNLLS